LKTATSLPCLLSEAEIIGKLIQEARHVPITHPAQQVFNWHCRSNNIPESNLSAAAVVTPVIMV
jgi:hypothetical protein